MPEKFLFFRLSSYFFDIEHSRSEYRSHIVTVGLVPVKVVEVEFAVHKRVAVCGKREYFAFRKVRLRTHFYFVKIIRVESREGKSRSLEPEVVYLFIYNYRNRFLFIFGNERPAAEIGLTKTFAESVIFAVLENVSVLF